MLALTMTRRGFDSPMSFCPPVLNLPNIPPIRRGVPRGRPFSSKPPLCHHYENRLQLCCSSPRRYRSVGSVPEPRFLSHWQGRASNPPSRPTPHPFPSPFVALPGPLRFRCSEMNLIPYTIVCLYQDASAGILPSRSLRRVFVPQRGSIRTRLSWRISPCPKLDSASKQVSRKRLGLS